LAAASRVAKNELPLSLTTNTVIGIGTNAVVSPASATACLASATVALLKNAGSCCLSQMPSYCGGALGLSDLVAEKALGRVRSLLPWRRRGYYQTFVKTKRRRR
jgi:hypothetical protein